MTILNDFLYYYENGSKIISPWGKEMIPLLLISYCPTYKLPKNHNESSSSFFLGCNYLRTAVRTWVDVQAQSQSYSYYRAAIYEDQRFFPLYMAAIARVVLVNVIRADGYTALERIFNWRALQTKWLVKKDC